MDPYSFLNTAHTAFFAELYNEYLLDPDSVEPSWRAFFQGFEFGIDKKSKNEDFLINWSKNEIGIKNNILNTLKYWITAVL